MWGLTVVLAGGCGVPSDSDAGSTGVLSSASSTGETTEPAPSTHAGDDTSSSGSSRSTSSDGESSICPGGPAHRVFDRFWATLDREYALFDIRLDDVTWDDVGTTQCALIGEDITDVELFRILVHTAETLDDGHIQLRGAGQEDDGWASPYPYYDALYELELNAESQYLDGPLSWAANDWFAWGTIGAYGYVSITSMDTLSNSGNEADDVDAARDALSQVFADLQTSAGIIVDVRANEGGWDAVSVELTRHFAGEPTLAWSEAVRNGPAHDDFGDWEDTFIPSAADDAYTGPVVVLSSGGTFSAAETFLLAMRERPQVVVLGERSSGHLSDIFDAELPNGWEFGFSGERYRAADGELYERIGVPPDTEVALDVDALDGGTDVMLEAALALLAR